jgi:hypothetical protein
MFRLNKLYLLIAWGISCFLFYGVAAHADETDQSTKLTFNEPVQIPGRTLPAGTYLFKLANADDKNFVQIFNADETTLYATVLTVPTLRIEVTGDTAVTFAQSQPGGPNALEKWFYPGRLTGHELLYPKHEEQQLARDRQVDIIAHPGAVESGD